MYKRGRHTGIGFIVKPEIASRVEDFRAISDRVAFLTVKINNRTNLKIIQIYAPTTAHENEEVELFYEDIRLAIQDQPANYEIIIGDFNAKIERKLEEDEIQIGNYGYGERNERG